MKKNWYSVVRIRIISEYVDIEAESEEKAIELAKSSEEWEEDANAWLNEYTYDAELIK